MMGCKSVLVVGLKSEHSGKTTLARAILRWMKEKDIEVCPFKPKAANHMWRDFDIIYQPLLQGRLYGRDVKLLKMESGVNIREEVINPVHRLWNDYETFDFLVDRVFVDGKTVLILNKSFIDANKRTNGLFEILHRNAEIVKYVSSMDPEELKGIYTKGIISSLKEISRDFGFVVIESYADVVLPFRIDNLSIVFGIKPWEILVYDARKYLMAVDLFHDDEISTEKIVPLLKPIEQIKIMPQTSAKVVEYLKTKVEPILKEYI